ncbi:hypothetical protein RUND412_006891 [Rhizina undulata]
MLSSIFRVVLLLNGLFVLSSRAALNVSETSASISISNDRLTAVLQKSLGSIVDLTLDGQDLLGPQSGSTGIGPYLDCYCIPSGFYTVGSTSPSYQVIQGTDSTGTSYGGIILSDTYTPTGQFFQQFWFLRDGETGLHLFTRLAYYNETTPFLRNLQELRTLFRPNTDLWTHLSTNEAQTAPLPSKDAIASEVVVQDATWTFENTPSAAYAEEFSDYFTKYTFSSDWRQNIAHGIYANGSTSDGVSYGAWLVMHTKDTYFGGPLHSDLTVDGIVYNYIVSNHHGEGTPNITNGFDRTFGPHYYHFNSGKGATIAELRADAETLADPSWNADFYDSIAQYVPNYVSSANRGSFEGKVDLPEGASNAIAVLSSNGTKFQDNSEDVTAYQYWGEIDADGNFQIPRVKAGTYRLTVYADGIFGDFIQDDLVVSAGETTKTSVTWAEESAGTEIWRLGTPDKSSGEFRHGNALDATHPRTPREYWIYWGSYDFPTDFPDSVNFTIGQDDIATDFNTVHWSVFGPTHDHPEIVTENINSWTINFDLTADDLKDKQTVTFTIQLAGAKTAAGNTDVYKSTELYNDLPLTTYVNDQTSGLDFVIPYYHSSSCIVRSAVSCYQVSKKHTFPAEWLKVGNNKFVLSLPYNGTDTETAVLTTALYVQYDALRLELA